VVHYTHVTYEGQVCGTSVVQSVSGNGPVTLILAVSKGISSTYSATATVNVGDLSGALGFSVTKSYTITDTARYTVPSGKFGVIEAYPLYDEYSFDISVVGNTYGSGYALKPVGICFNPYYL
jgi:hypothetical protein